MSCADSPDEAARPSEPDDTDSAGLLFEICVQLPTPESGVEPTRVPEVEKSSAIGVNCAETDSADARRSGSRSIFMLLRYVGNTHYYAERGNCPVSSFWMRNSSIIR